MSSYARQFSDRINSELKSIESSAWDGGYFVESSNQISQEEAFSFLKGAYHKSKLVMGGSLTFENGFNGTKEKMYSVSRYDSKIVESINIVNVEEDWYIVPKETHKVYWSDPYFDDDTRRVCSRVTVPILKDNVFVGCSSVKIDLTQFQSFEDSTVYETLNFVIVNASGQFVYHPNSDRIMVDNILNTNLGSIELSELHEEGSKMVNGESGKAVLSFRDENKFLWAYYAPIPVAKVGARSSQQRLSLFEGLRNRRCRKPKF